jgi:DNA-binding NarL/FixJ family response regulator
VQASVALLIAAGYTNLEIAEQLAISNHTVKRHVEAIFERFQIRSRSTVDQRLLDVLTRVLESEAIQYD